ncbi:hypothetical protein L1276_002627 [Flavobacterium sp. HSC-32F16]|uniref:hypothetical protein n=1 Tax=Flavobacterium sp. HSC-32F16 TaxID=2910964 RepID=UPI0020A38573|nr:hypothetical protein [Flavobacterium sp. HSC-32F16]MCP2027470.1 hypothetical protein [Flavobacterium sp. HSC-32F16]
MSTNHNRIKVADLETDQPNKILITNQNGELEFNDIKNIQINNYNALDYTAEGKALDARQGKVLKDSIDALNSTKQNNFTEANVGAFENTVPTLTIIADTDKMPLLVGSLRRMISWANFKALFKTVNGNSLFGNGNIVTPNMDTTTAQPVSGVKTFLNLMLGLRNVSNTFTSFVTNSATASRTWAFPDKNGTVAMTSDLPTNILNTGTQHKLVKYLNTAGTQGGESRLKDDGTYLGIGSVSPIALVKDIQLGRDGNKEIGIEQSDSITNGKSLIISAGRTINFQETTAFLLSQNIDTICFGSTHADNGDLYIGSQSGNIYVKPKGNDFFTLSTSIPVQVRGMGRDYSNNIYACSSAIYKRTNAAGVWTAVDSNNRSWRQVNGHPNGNIYATCGGEITLGDIYMQTGGSGPFVTLGQGDRNWAGIACHPNGNVYAAVYNGDIYMQTGGTGDFAGLGQTIRSYYQMAVIGTDIYATCYSGAIVKQTNGTGNFIDIGIGSPDARGGITSSSEGVIFYTLTNGMVYKNQSAIGTPNLNGGTLRLNAGTGKGTGQSRVQITTGAKITSGTNMQTEIIRTQWDETGLMKQYGNVEITGLTKLGQYTTAARPEWQLGFEFFDTTINKKVIGGASGWEVVTSS